MTPLLRGSDRDLKYWVLGWVPRSVFSLGNDLSSVEAWFYAALDIEEVLSGTGGDQLHVMVADVIKSFDTVDHSILDCSLGRLGLPAWFVKVYFSFHDHVRLRFTLAAGLGESWCRGGGIPQGCPLGMVFIVALCVTWCWRLEAMPPIRPQLYADGLVLFPRGQGCYSWGCCGWCSSPWVQGQVGFGHW